MMTNTAQGGQAEGSTMLAAILRYGEQETLARLADGRLVLTGNFKGHEQDVVAQAEAA